jgi:hypothetical protein
VGGTLKATELAATPGHPRLMPGTYAPAMTDDVPGNHVPVDHVPMDYVPVAAGPWRLTMGLRPLDPARWLEVDDLRAAELDLKAQLLTEHHGRVVATLPGTAAAGTEVLELVLSHLDYHHPGLVTARPPLLHERSTASTIDTTALHPIDAAARVVQEDLCLMVNDGDSWVLGAASVCFPSRWDLAGKLGQDLAGIHQSVPGYAEALGQPTETFFDRLRPERPVWRLNWTLIDHPALHQPDPATRIPGPPTDRTAPGERPGLWLRVERQTLRRLEHTDAVIFTIRTYVSALEDHIQRHPKVVPALLATLPTVPAATVAYKGWDGMVGPLLARLRSHPSGGPGDPG